LLVVVALLGILLAILLPSVLAAKRLARESLCGTRLRGLSVAGASFAADNSGWLPNLGTDGLTKFSGGEARPHVIHRFWRDHLGSKYGLKRESLYSPCNRGWNRDDFWDYGGAAGDLTVIGFFHFGNRPDFESATIGQVQSAFPEVTAPMFARKLNDSPHFTFLWTDLNLQDPPGSFVSPTDAKRWGANHYLPSDGKVRGSHVGGMDGSVRWISGHQLQNRCTYDGAAYFW
jgi:hypothetical protein